MKKDELKKIISDKLKDQTDYVKQSIYDCIIDILRYYRKEALEETLPHKVDFQVGMQIDLENKYFGLEGFIIYHDCNSGQADFTLEISFAEIHIDQYIDFQLNMKKIRRENYVTNDQIYEANQAER